MAAASVAPVGRRAAGSPSRAGQESVPTTTMVDVPLLPGSTSSRAAPRRPPRRADHPGRTARHPPGRRPRPGRARCCSPATPASARPGCSPSSATAPSPRAGRSSSGTASTSATAPCPTCRSPRCSAGCATDSPALVDAIAEQHPALARLPPGRRLLSGSEPSADSAADSAVDRGALFDAVHALLDAAGDQRPLLLVIEDAHWADRSTRDLLSFLFSRAVRRPVAIVASYRSDDLHRRHPLRAVAAEWARIPGVARMQLDPLPSDDVRALVHQLAPDAARPRPRSPASCSAPRATRSSSRSWSARPRLAQSLPDDLADLLLVRLDRLGDEAAGGRPRGRRGRPPVSATTCWRPAAPSTHEALDVGLRDAVGAQRAGAGEGRRLRVPARAARRGGLRRPAAGRAGAAARGVRRRARRATAARGTAAELARHARAAHDLATAFDASIRAGDEAMSVGGPDEAARHYEAALELLADPAFPRGGGGRPGAPSAPGRSTRCWSPATLPGRCRWPRACSKRLPADAPPPGAGSCWSRWPPAILVRGEPARPARLHRRGARADPRRAVGAAGARPAHARPGTRRGDIEFATARDIAVEALVDGRVARPAALGSDVLTTLAGIQRRAGGESDEDIEAAIRNVAAVASEAGAAATEVRAIWLLGRWHFDRADYVAAREAFQRAVRRADALGQPWSPYALDARFACQQVAFMLGDWDTVLELADLSGQVPPPIPEAMFAAGPADRAGGARRDRGAASRRPGCGRSGRRTGRSRSPAGPPTIELHALAGDRDAALRRARRRGGHPRPHLARVLPRARADLRGDGRCARARHRRRVGRGPRAASPHRWTQVVEGGETTVRHLREVGDEWGPEGAAWVLRLHAEQLRFRWLAGIDPPSEEELVEAWRADLAGFEAMGHVYEIARVADPAGRGAARGGRPGGGAASSATRPAPRHSGSGPDRCSTTSGPPVAPRTRSRAATRDEQLTPREREILALVADGPQQRRDRQAAVHLHQDGRASTSPTSWPSSVPPGAPRPRPSPGARACCRLAAARPPKGCVSCCAGGARLTRLVRAPQSRGPLLQPAPTGAIE